MGVRLFNFLAVASGAGSKSGFEASRFLHAALVQKQHLSNASIYYNLAKLRARITTKVQANNVLKLKYMFKNLIKGAQMCKHENGHHFQHSL